MRRSLRSIARFLVAILLVTVLSPSFAWEVTAGDSAHENVIVTPDGGGDAHDQDSEAASHHSDDDSHHHHHGCAGHSFGHLPGHIAEASTFAILDTVRGGFPELAADFPSPFPDRLDRPPLAPALA